MIKLILEHTDMEMECSAVFLVNNFTMNCRQKTTLIVKMPDGWDFLNGQLIKAPLQDYSFSICERCSTRLNVRFGEEFGMNGAIVITEKNKSRWEWDDLTRDVHFWISEQNQLLNKSNQYNPGNLRKVRVIMPLGKETNDSITIKAAVFTKVNEVNGIGRYIFSHIESI